jgi:hypothetical protein
MVVTLTVAPHASNTCGVGGGVTCRHPADQWEWKTATRNSNPASATINQYQLITPPLLVFLGPFSIAPGCRTLHTTLVSCWSMYTCAATAVHPVNSLRRASYPLRKLSSGTDGTVLDSRTPNPPHGHSSASSLDLIAISEDEEALVISQLIPRVFWALLPPPLLANLYRVSSISMRLLSRTLRARTSSGNLTSRCVCPMSWTNN